MRRLRIGWWLLAGLFALLAFCVLFLVSRRPPFRVAVLVNLSGPGGKAGRYIRDGILYAMEEESRGCPVKFVPVVKDYDETDEKLKECIDELLEEGVWVALGPVTSRASRVAVSHLREKGWGLMLLTAYAATTELSGKKDLFIRTSVDNALFVKALERWMEKSGVKRLFVVVDEVNPDFAVDIYRNIEKDAHGALRLEDLEAVSFNSKKEMDFDRIVERVLKASPDAVLLITRSRETAILAKKLRDKGYKKYLVGTIWTQTPDLIRWGGDAVEGFVVISFVSPSYNTPVFERLSRGFKKRMGYPLNARAIRAVELVQVLCSAVKRVYASGGRLSLETLASSILGHCFNGTVMGRVCIDENGDAVRPVFESVVERGRFVKKGVLIGNP